MTAGAVDALQIVAAVVVIVAIGTTRSARDLAGAGLVVPDRFLIAALEQRSSARYTQTRYRVGDMTGGALITGAKRLETRIPVATVTFELAVLAIDGATSFRPLTQVRFLIAANARSTLTVVSAIGLNRATAAVVEDAIATAAGLTGRGSCQHE